MHVVTNVEDEGVRWSQAGERILNGEGELAEIDELNADLNEDPERQQKLMFSHGMLTF